MALAQDNIRALDQLRQRLAQLSSSIQSLKVDLERNEPLPTPSSIASSAQILSLNLAQLNQTFAEHRQFLTAAHAYPLPTFPGQTQETLLGQLVKKKLEPRAQDWVDGYSKPRLQAQANGVAAEDDGNAPLSNDELIELWNWAGPTSNGIVRGFISDDAFEDDFTLAEREAGIENVVTGLRRSLIDEDEDEDEDEDTKMEDVSATGGTAVDKARSHDGQQSAERGVDPTQPPMAMERMLRFLSSGNLPS